MHRSASICLSGLLLVSCLLVSAQAQAMSIDPVGPTTIGQCDENCNNWCSAHGLFNLPTLSCFCFHDQYHGFWSGLRCESCWPGFTLSSNCTEYASNPDIAKLKDRVLELEAEVLLLNGTAKVFEKAFAEIAGALDRVFRDYKVFATISTAEPHKMIAADAGVCTLTSVHTRTLGAQMSEDETACEIQVLDNHWVLSASANRTAVQICNAICFTRLDPYALD